MYIVVLYGLLGDVFIYKSSQIKCMFCCIYLYCSHQRVMCGVIWYGEMVTSLIELWSIVIHIQHIHSHAYFTHNL